ncbi:unnamed protein product [Vitrella brassicaformis CCMP3155]|uniref:Uncharacterized protein n=1 Tax=Vitrella brassicaformis (strain CCMP3155) TaxID=1169540 RepID=A0A0G4FU93_VITBC|nr:unnamed protein product [Vitrella brassicaformis CCMP3155]|eukprot:CEM17886.1 unnamed protein product [Vitrella brassicaformis CCMP3155]
MGDAAQGAAPYVEFLPPLEDPPAEETADLPVTKKELWDFRRQMRDDTSKVIHHCNDLVASREQEVAAFAHALRDLQTRFEELEMSIEGRRVSAYLKARESLVIRRHLSRICPKDPNKDIDFSSQEVHRINWAEAKKIDSTALETSIHNGWNDLSASADPQDKQTALNLHRLLQEINHDKCRHQGVHTGKESILAFLQHDERTAAAPPQISRPYQLHMLEYKDKSGVKLADTVAGLEKALKQDRVAGGGQTLHHLDSKSVSRTQGRQKVRRSLSQLQSRWR